VSKDVSSELGQQGGRYRVMSSVELWHRTRVILIYVGMVILVGEGIVVLEHHEFQPSYLAVAVIVLLMAGLIFWRQRHHYVELGPDALVLRSNFRTAGIPYSQIRQSRCSTLRQFFDTPTRRELLTGGLRRYAASSVCIVRVDMEPSQLLSLGRMLGRRTVLDQDLILIVQQPDLLDRGLQLRLRRRPPAPAARTTRRRR
jgi:hypothetical protein